MYNHSWKPLCVNSHARFLSELAHVRADSQQAVDAKGIYR